jgi:hypothetical protein
MRHVNTGQHADAVAHRDDADIIMQIDALSQDRVRLQQVVEQLQVRRKPDEHVIIIIAPACTHFGCLQSALRNVQLQIGQATQVSALASSTFGASM